MRASQHLPDANRLSVVTATILLVYALTPFVDLPGQNIAIQLPGFLFQMQLNFNTIVSILGALLAAAGIDWLMQGHPTAAGKPRLPNWILPALTTVSSRGSLRSICNFEWWVGLPLAACS